MATSEVEPSGAQITLRRADVARVLYDHTKDDVDYIFGGFSVGRLREGATGVEVSFESRAERQYDLVIGADGLHSAVRRISFGEDVRSSGLGHRALDAS